jgi:hypothetical protein
LQKEKLEIANIELSQLKDTLQFTTTKGEARSYLGTSALKFDKTTG